MVASDGSSGRQAGRWFGILGPVEVVMDGRPVELPSHRPRVLLAALLLRPNRTIPVGQLIDLLWRDDELPSRPRSALQVYVSRLRAALGDVDRRLISTDGTGYCIHLDVEQLDLTEFRRLVEQAETESSAEIRAALLAEACEVWRGEPVADLDTQALTRNGVPRLLEERLHAVELHLEAQMELGQSAAVIPRLLELVGRHPTREHLWAMLMRAQHAVGRPADAFATYSDVSRRLADLLGAGPGPELRELHQALLAVTEPGSTVIPQQLPIGLRAFTGRTAELRNLDEMLHEDRRSGVVLLIGPAGIGKTALAVQWARRIADRFPDGVLYVDLKGFAPSAEPAEPADVLNQFLVALGLSPDQLAVGDQATLFRSVLADRSVLVVLDNARSADQVRPLLATGPNCLTLVTSRSELVSLVAAEQARPIRLDLLTPAEARQLLAARVGSDRLSQDAAAIDELITRCAGLPLALTLVAAQLELRPTWSLDKVVSSLRDAPLDALTCDDSEDPRTIFSWSYRHFQPNAARMFRVLRVPAAGGAPAVSDPTTITRGRVGIELSAAPAGRRSTHGYG
jgi:DNA-binding SARP family transcriptional activator